MVLQGLQFGKVRRLEVRLAGDFGEQVQKTIDRCQEGRVIAQLAPQLMAYFAPQVDICDGQNVDSNNDEFQEYRHKSGETQPCIHASGPMSCRRYRALVSLVGSQVVRLKQHFGHFPAFHAVFAPLWVQSLVVLRAGWWPVLILSN